MSRRRFAGIVRDRRPRDGPMKRFQVGVMGSAGGVLTDEQIDLARRVGAAIARSNSVIVTGACPGLPHAAVLGAHAADGVSLGISPAHSREEHLEDYESPVEPYTTMVYTGSGLMGREVENIHSSDFVIFIGGRSGTLGEFAIAFDEGKLIGILRDSGGIANQLSYIASIVDKRTGAVLIEDTEPERLVAHCMERFLTEPQHRSTEFTRG